MKIYMVSLLHRATIKKRELLRRNGPKRLQLRITAFCINMRTSGVKVKEATSVQQFIMSCWSLSCSLFKFTFILTNVHVQVTLNARMLAITCQFPAFVILVSFSALAIGGGAYCVGRGGRLPPPHILCPTGKRCCLPYHLSASKLIFRPFHIEHL